MQRRRQVEEEVALAASLRTRVDDVGVLVEWAQGGEDVEADLTRGLADLAQAVESGEIKKMLGGEPDRAHAAPSRRTGPRCCCGCT
jgi:hypothetical protein